MQGTLNKVMGMSGNWLALSRVKGIARYRLRTLSVIVIWILAVMAGSGMLALFLPALFALDTPNFNGVSANMAVAVITAFVCGCITAHRHTRFCLRPGTPRLPVWLCNLLTLALAMAVILVGSMLISASLGLLTYQFSLGSASFTLSGYTSIGFLEGSEFLSVSLNDALKGLPRQIGYLTEWSCLCYFIGCCLRRKKWLTLTIIIGVPLAYVLLMVIPVLRRTIETAMDGQPSELIIMGMQWMRWLMDILRFIRNEWPSVLFGTAVISLPLGYWCMRGTKFP
ncbi:MAG: hypothetical protein FWF47_03865 [Clostridia bacterium]|nr:hypothetical protein [Clostridia bacterium]